MPVKIACGFAVAALTLAVFVAPSADKLVASVTGTGLDQVDPMTTATVSRPKVTKRYIVRRSVLQKSPTAECRIYADGLREGDC